MAFFTNPVLATSKVNAAQGATSGRKMHTIPATSPTLTNSSDRLPGCAGCTLEATHDVCRAILYEPPYDEHRYARVTQSGRADRAEFNRLQSALFILGHIANGTIRDEVLFNAGAANNASQFAAYEIVSASGTTLTLKGPNPKRITMSVSRENPNWPFGDDPLTNDPARLQSDPIDIALPVGAEVEFLAPSVLASKVRPWVVSISVPASTVANDVTFSVTVSSSVSNAKTPFDDGVAAANQKYFCKLRFELARPATWANLQSPRERAWTKRTQTITSAANTALTNGSGNTRILWPDMGVGVDLFSAKVILNDATEYLLDPFETVGGNPRLVTTQSGTWTTMFNVSDLTFGANPTDVDEVQVTFFHQAVNGTGLFVHHTSQCANSQREISGSYAHNDGHRCMAVDSTGFANYQRECWQPGGCDRFALGDEVDTYGPQPYPVSNFGRPSWFSGFWHRATWFLKQGVAGSASNRNFTLDRPAGDTGPSIASLAGAWINQVPDGKFPRHIPWWGPTFGRRETWTDSGDEFQMLVHGAFFEEGFIAGGAFDSNWWNATGSPTTGVVASEVTGWTTKPDATGTAARATLRNLPYRYTGRTNAYTYVHGSASLGKTNVRQTGSETFVANANLTVVDTALNAQIQARF